MSAEPPPIQPATSKPTISRPDPFFKRLTQQQALNLGIRLENNELPIQQTTFSDLVLTVPPEVATQGTLFDSDLWR